MKILFNYIVMRVSSLLSGITCFCMASFLVSISLFSFSSPSFANEEMRQFKVSAYYSPLKGQEKYVSGSYSADIKMNGNGTHGADGTPVYVGMISAPSTYPFGTKIQLDTLGVGVVHDRGGAIYSSRNYDRLDIWMGYGDEGRVRALQWGVRMVEGKILTDDTPEGYLEQWTAGQQSSSSSQKLINIQNSDYFSVNMSIDKKNSAEEVSKMQKFLQSQGFFNIYHYGYYGSLTKESVMKFQLFYGVINNESDFGAGVWGPQTRAMANKLYNEKKATDIENKKELEIAIEKKEVSSVSFQSIGDIENTFIENNTPNVISSLEPSDSFDFSVSLWRGQKNQSKEEVKKMQRFLKAQKIYKGSISGKYSAVVEESVFQFQVQNNIVNSRKQRGAGVWGPQTRAIGNKQKEL